MCRADVAPVAESLLAELLIDMRNALAAGSGVDPAEVRVGPVDFGAEPVAGQEAGT